MKELRIEHFKSLKEEYRQYLFQVQQLWIFKLSTLGLVIAAAIFHDKIIKIGGLDTETIAAAGLFALPALAFLIDLKALEIGLHVKLISEHLKENFNDVPEILVWESNFWSGKTFSLLRTIFTIITAIGTSFAVLIISFLLIYGFKPECGLLLLIAGIISVVIAGLVSIKIIPKLMK